MYIKIGYKQLLSATHQWTYQQLSLLYFDTVKNVTILRQALEWQEVSVCYDI